MAMQWSMKYAIHIVSSHFGDLTAKICKCLLRKGPLTQQHIARFVEKPTEHVHHCLLLLVQHNIVQAFTVEDAGGFGDEVKHSTEYVVVFDNIIHRTRFPKFLRVVSQELDEGCVELFEGFGTHGRLTFEKMIDRAKEGKPIQEHFSIENAVRENLLKLAQARFVERSPAIEPFLAPPSEEELAAKKRALRSSKIAPEPDPVERVMEAAAPMEAMRFLVTDSEKAEDGSADVGADVGAKRKRSFLASDNELGIKEEVSWRVNYEEFLRRCRHKACVENVRERLDDGAAIALSSMLEAGRRMESKLKTKTSVPVSINAIYEEAIKAEAGRRMTLDDLRDYLSLLECHRGADESYSIDLKSILKLAKYEEAESTVLERDGKDAYRIFRLLSKAGVFLETDKISDTVFVEKKETSKILYKLWKDEYIHMQKVIANGIRQSTHELWKVNKCVLWKNVLEDLYHAALNLRMRLAHEDPGVEQYASLPPEKRKQWRSVKVALEGSLMQLDEAIMLFHDF